MKITTSIASEPATGIAGRRARLLVLVAMIGCKPNEPSLVSLADPLPDGSATAFAGADIAGPTPLTVRFRALNGWGAPTAGGAVTVTRTDAAGATSTHDLRFDAQGIATVVEEQAGSTTWTMPDGTSTTAHAFAADWRAPDAIRATPWSHEVRHLSPWTGGAVVGDDAGRLWLWLDHLGAEPVLDLGDARRVAGAHAADLDRDGLADLVAWDHDTIYLLRGLPDGRVAWVGGRRAEGGSLGGVSVTDLNGDGRDDLAAAWSLGASHTLELFTSRGLFDLELVGQTALPEGPSSLAASHSADDVPRVDVLFDHGALVRYVWADDTLTNAGVVAPHAIPVGSSLLGAEDVDGDGAAEVIVAGPLTDAVARDVWLFDLDRSPTSYTERNPIAAHLAIADADEDGLPDLWSLDAERRLRVLTSRSGGQIEWSVATLEASRPFAVTPLDPDDGVVDLVLAAPDRLILHRGEAVDPSDGAWRLRPDGLDNLLDDLLDVALVADADADATTVDWVGVQRRAAEIYVKVWTRAPGAATVVERARLLLGEGDRSFRDLAVCDDRVYLLLEDGLLVLDAANRLAPLADRPDLIGSRVACTGGDTTLIALLADDGAHILDADLAPLAVESVGPAEDVAIGPSATDAAWTLTACTAPGCTAAIWPIGQQAPRSIQGTDTSTSVDGQEVAPGFYGHPRVGPVDADATPDLWLVRPDGWVTVQRSTGDSAGPPEGFQLRRRLAGPAFFGDADGDGTPDLFAVDEDGVLFVTP